MTTRRHDTRQWQHVRDEREAQKNSANYPVRESLEQAWELLDDFYGPGLINKDERFINREDEDADSPLAALMFFTEMGFYPPPELLLGLLKSWREYLDSAGTISLEEVFIGKSKRKAGNYASRRNRKNVESWLLYEVEKRVKQGKTQLQAAEDLTRTYPLKMDPESIVRVVRNHWMYKLQSKRKKQLS